jgi:hypothetical protein
MTSGFMVSAKAASNALPAKKVTKPMAMAAACPSGNQARPISILQDKMRRVSVCRHVGDCQIDSLAERFIREASMGSTTLGFVI